MNGSPSSLATEELLVYVAAAGGGGVRGLCFDPKAGTLEEIECRSELPGAHYLAVHPDAGLLFAAGDDEEVGERPRGRVCAYAIDRSSGKLRYLNAQPTGGTTPCHVSVDPTGRGVFVANFRQFGRNGAAGSGSPGSVSAFPIRDGGELGEAVYELRIDGSSIHADRQTNSHPHSVAIAPGGRFACAADLGTDQIITFELASAPDELAVAERSRTKVEPGTGPRHIVFHPSGRFAYAITEISDAIIAFGHDPASGGLEALQTVSALPPDLEGGGGCADIRVHPNGRWLYGSNRGNHHIVIYAIDEATGGLEYAGCFSTGGECPRGFCLDPTGRFLFVANQGSDELVVFPVDPESGGVGAALTSASVPGPVCMQVIRK
jgi:6-phosphogluconolactonase